MADLTGLTICVGYVIPIGCCVTGLCMSGYGCYRYFKTNQERQRRLRLRHRLAMNGVIEEQPRVKKDTLKKQITSEFKGGKRQLPKKLHPPCTDMADGCTICLDDYDGNPDQIFIGYVLKCGHFFHFECIWEWLECNRSCPICREDCQIDITDISGVSLEQVHDLLLNSLTGVENQAFTKDGNHGKKTDSVNQTVSCPESPSVAIGTNYAFTLAESVTSETTTNDTEHLNSDGASGRTNRDLGSEAVTTQPLRSEGQPQEPANCTTDETSIGSFSTREASRKEDDVPDELPTVHKRVTMATDEP